MSDPTFELDELVAAMRLFAMERDRFEDAIARRHGITHTDLIALDHLSLNDGLTPSQLGERLMLTSGAVTGLADRLEALGWIAREPHPSDRRSTVLRLTAKATAVAEKTFGPYVDELNAAAARLGPRERAACMEFLGSARSVAAAHAEHQAGSAPRRPAEAGAATGPGSRRSTSAK